MWYDKMVNPEPEPAPKPVTPLPDALKGYTDLDPNAWYISALDTAVQRGYIHGYSATVLAPTDALTRGQATCIIANAAGVTFEAPYDDVDASPYYYDSVVWAKEQGIVSDAENFRPNDPCTREEFIAMLCNWKGSHDVIYHTDDISDWSDVSEWAKSAVAWALDAEVIHGNNGSVRPKDVCSRAEAVAMLVNLLD